MADLVAEFFDIKFCPDQPLNQAAVFAAVSKKQVRIHPSATPMTVRCSSKPQVVICKLACAKDDPSPCEVISIIRDTDVSLFPHLLTPTMLYADYVLAKDAAENCCCTWSRDLHTGRPLICVAGKDAKIKVYDVANGDVTAVGCSMRRKAYLRPLSWKQAGRSGY